MNGRLRPVLLAACLLLGFGAKPSSAALAPSEDSASTGERDSTAISTSAALGDTAGDFTLNTYAWDYGPWMRRFHEELLRHWETPYAYKLGMIHGEVVLRVVVAKDGAISDVEVTRREGHPSLANSSIETVRNLSELIPLPEGFPEDRLILDLTMRYPERK